MSFVTAKPLTAKLRVHAQTKRCDGPWGRSGPPWPARSDRATSGLPRPRVGGGGRKPRRHAQDPYRTSAGQRSPTSTGSTATALAPDPGAPARRLERFAARAAGEAERGLAEQSRPSRRRGGHPRRPGGPSRRRTPGGGKRGPPTGRRFAGAVRLLPARGDADGAAHAALDLGLAADGLALLLALGATWRRARGGGGAATRAPSSPATTRNFTPLAGAGPGAFAGRAFVARRREGDRGGNRAEANTGRQSRAATAR